MNVFAFSIDEDTAERLRVSFRWPTWAILYGAGVWGAFAALFLWFGSFPCLPCTITGLVLVVISACILGSSKRLKMGTLAIDSANMLVATGIHGRETTAFGSIEKVQIADYGSDQDLWIFPREGEMIVAARRLSPDQASFLKEQVERRVGVQVIVEKVEGPRSSRIHGEVPLDQPPNV